MPPVAPSNKTVDPSLRSWVESANDPASEFPIQNLPFCFYRTVADDEVGGIGMRIGDSVVDVDMLMHAGQLGDPEGDDGERLERIHEAVHIGDLGMLLAAPEQDGRWVRERVQRWLLDGPAGGQQGRRLREKAVLPVGGLAFETPLVVPNYTDFYASIHHARTVGSMFRPDNPLLPNYKHVPIGYHGRASSIVASGTPVRRPMGQTKADGQDAPVFGPSKRLDYELEVGCIIASGNPQGEPIDIDEAPDHIAGFVLVNDWSARDVQAWEYQPLGPFLAKNFATTISPYIVMADALEPFRVPGPARAEGDPQPLAYLRGRDEYGLDITVEAYLQSAAMRDKGMAAVRVSRGSLREMYWTFPQLIAHHTSNGCNLQPGDLLASGTVSGEAAETRGCLLELTWQGNGPDGKPLPRRPIALPTGETRTFLEDGDAVILRGRCERSGYRSIGFGECAGVVLPARN